MPRHRSLIVCVLCLLILSVASTAKSDRGRSLAEGKKMLARFKEHHKTLDDWKDLAAHVRKHIRRGCGLSNWPERIDMKPIVHSKRTHDGYTVENIALETLPGFYATGNLYRPTKVSKSYPVILCPHGHFANKITGVRNGRIRPDMQKRCATLCRMGAIVLTIDQIGNVDSTQMGHNDPLSLPLQIWNNIRGVDYLLSLEGADTDRVAVTGASGGGSQTLQLAALDPRVDASCCVVMMACNFNGGCLCESGMPIFRSKDHETNLTQMGALAAPGPQLIISCGEDWTVHTPDVDYPYVRGVYDLYGKGDKVKNLHLGKEGHNYAFSKRNGMYRFFAKHLKMDLKAVLDSEGKIDESQVTIEPKSKLLVFTQQHPRPKHAAQGRAALAEILKKSTAVDAK